MQEAIDKAMELASRTEKSFIPMQFSNQANACMHRLTTAIEIWNDTGGNVDFCGRIRDRWDHHRGI